MADKKPSKRADTSIIHVFNKDENIVSMTEHKGKVYVATNRAVYYIKGDKLYQLKLTMVEEPE